MKNKTIHITSLAKGTRVTIDSGKRVRKHWLTSIDESIKFVLPRGDRRTDLFINGYLTVLNGWVE